MGCSFSNGLITGARAEVTLCPGGGGGPDLNNPTRRNQRRVGVGEQVFYLFVREIASVQADLRHLDRRVFEDREDLLEGLILQAGANHPSL